MQGKKGVPASNHDEEDRFTSSIYILTCVPSRTKPWGNSIHSRILSAILNLTKIKGEKKVKILEMKRWWKLGRRRRRKEVNIFSKCDAHARLLEEKKRNGKKHAKQSFIQIKASPMLHISFYVCMYVCMYVSVCLYTYIALRNIFFCARRKAREIYIYI